MKQLLAARGTPAAIVGVLVLAVAGGGYAIASGTGTITVCVQHNGGGLYKATKCAKRDKRLSWNKVGQRGATGATGAAGQNGATGATGAAGQNGVTGPAGPVTLTHLLSVAVSCAGGTACAGASPPCPAGQVPISGEVIGENTRLYTIQSREQAGAWSGVVENTAASSATFKIGVICSSSTTATGF
jgi:hypothetical protein